MSSDVSAIHGITTAGPGWLARFQEGDDPAYYEPIAAWVAVDFGDPANPVHSTDFMVAKNDEDGETWLGSERHGCTGVIFCRDCFRNGLCGKHVPGEP